MDEKTKNEITESIMREVSKVTMRTFIDPPSFVRWLMAKAAIGVLEAYERGRIAGEEI